MYTLDFETIKQVMQEHQKSGFLHAEVPSGVASLREPCRIEISIQAGAIASCTIIGSSGKRLTGKNATDALSRLGRLYWTFTPQQEVVAPPRRETSPIPVPTADSLFPRRIAYLDQHQMRNWSRLHRAIFALADGTKSAAKIAEMLSTSPDLVSRALRELQTIGVIAMGPHNRQYHP
jgi:hypothetical protein